MIRKSQAYFDSNNIPHATLEAAQRADIDLMFELAFKEPKSPEKEVSATDVILANSAKLIDILTTGPKSLPGARKINGGSKKRNKSKTPAANQPPLIPDPAEAATPVEG